MGAYTERMALQKRRYDIQDVLSEASLQQTAWIEITAHAVQLTGNTCALCGFPYALQRGVSLIKTEMGLYL